MIIDLIKNIVWIGLILFLIYICKSKFSNLRKFLLCALTIIAVVISQFTLTCFKSFKSFETCSEAYEYSQNEKFLVAIDGDRTILAKGENYICTLLKSDKGYRMNPIPLTIVKAGPISNYGACSVYKDLLTGEYYISIFFADDFEPDLSENNELTFTEYESTYYAYISDFDDDFSVIVNGETIKLHNLH